MHRISDIMSEMLLKRIAELEKANTELLQSVSVVKTVYEKYFTNFSHLQMFIFDRFEAR